MPKHLQKWIIAFSGAIVIVLLFRAFFVASYISPSDTIDKRILSNERIIVNKWSYGLRLPLMALSSYHRYLEKPIKRRDIVLFNNPANYKEEIIDRREVLMGSCIGIPGDTLWIDSTFSATPSGASNQQFLEQTYRYPANKDPLLCSVTKSLSISLNEPIDRDSLNHIIVRSFNFDQYHDICAALGNPTWLTSCSHTSPTIIHPLIIPGKGRVVKVYPWNRTLLRNTLVLHEHKKAEIKRDTLFIDGKPTQHCYFTKDYYWMTTTPGQPTGSQLFGLVPKDHIIGKAWFIWFSKNTPSAGQSAYRWNRFFKAIH